MSFLKQYKGKVIVISSRNCPSCDVLKRNVEKSDAKDKFVFLNVEDSEVAKIIADGLNIMSVPTIVTVEYDGKEAKVCVWDDNFNKKLRCIKI